MERSVIEIATGVCGRIATDKTWRETTRVRGGSSFAKFRNHGFASSVMAQFSPEQEENKMLNLPTIDMVATGQNILRLRQQCGFSVKDLQEIFGFATPQAIYKWQHGTALPTLDNLLVLAMVFDVHMEDILVVNTSIQIRLGA